MVKLFRRTLGTALAIVLVAGCGDETLIFPGGPAGAAVVLDLSNSLFELRAGESATLGMAGRDEAGNLATGDPSVSSCNSSVASVSSGAGDDHWAGTATVTAAGLGETCLIVSLGSLAETLTVRTGAFAIEIAGGDTVGSGNTSTFDLMLYDASAAAVTPGEGFTFPELVATSAARLGVVVDDANPTSFAVSGRGPGVGRLQVVAPNGVSAIKDVVIVAGTFGGTLSSASGAGGLVATATREASGPAFDGDTEISIAGVSAWVDAYTADDIMFAVPATGATGAQTLLMANLDADQLAQEVDFDVTSATGDTYAPANEDTCGGCVVAGAPDVVATMTANNNMYFVHGGYGTGSASRSAWNGGANPDHYFIVTTGGADVAVTLTLEWTNGSDVDIFVLDAGGTEVANGFSGSSTNEIVTFTFPANSTHYVAASMWSAGSDITNFRFNFGGL